MFKLNASRTYKYPVHVVIYDEDGGEQRGKFTGIFRVINNSELKEMPGDEMVLKRSLVGVEGLEILGPDGQALSGQDLVDAVIDDPRTNAATLTAYLESIAKKNRARN